MKVGSYRRIVPIHRSIAICLMLFVCGVVAPAPERGGEVRNACDPVNAPPIAIAGEARVVSVGELVTFFGHGISLDGEIAEYRWDFDGDGAADHVSAATGRVQHAFMEAGEYRSLLTVREVGGGIARDVCRVIVLNEPADSATTDALLHPARKKVSNRADGTVERFAVMINGGYEERFWEDVKFGYDMLVHGYGMAPGNVYLLNFDGWDPYWENPDGMIDGQASHDELDDVFDQLVERTDEDDELFIWITDHGSGYYGPNGDDSEYLGYVGGRYSIDPGDELDYPENAFLLRSLYTGGNYSGNHGLNVWRVYCEGCCYPIRIYRQIYLSIVDSVYVESWGSVVNDSDIYIERLIDYTLGDTNQDGWIDTDSGEVYDFDDDGNPPFDATTGEFDPDDWGEIDYIYDDYSYLNTRLPQGAGDIMLFDENFNGKLCIDLGYKGGTPEVDGRDEDGLGLFDWLDVNQDGDLDDTISIDESISLSTGRLYDDDLADLLDQLSVAKITVVAQPCFSGGLIDDLSAPGRIICTSTTEEDISYGNTFIRAFTAALHGQEGAGSPVNADADSSGQVSMVEAFQHAVSKEADGRSPQYDDNGDGESHTAPIPSEGDGAVGASTFLCDSGAVKLDDPIFTPGDGYYTDAFTVEISCSDNGAELHYTTDNLDPTLESPIYTGPVPVDHRLVLKARAFRQGAFPSECAVASYGMPGERIVYVAPTGDDSKDGLAWSSAKRTITAALEIAMPGDDIWVRGDSAHSYCEQIAIGENIAIFGGFTGTEDSLSQRLPFPRQTDDPYRTILDGDSLESVITTDRGVSAITLLDGLTIRNGSAYSGGGVHCEEGSPTIRNCTVTENFAGKGGGIYCDDFCSPRIENTLILSNHSQTSGGGIHCGLGSAPLLQDCTIAGNDSYNGGAVCCLSNSESGHPRFVNCRISENSAGCGGGFFCRNCDLDIYNCTITGNSASGEGGGFRVRYGHTSINNSIVRENESNEGDDFYLSDDSELDLRYSDISADADAMHGSGNFRIDRDEGCIDADPVFNNPNGSDNCSATWKDNDFSLSGWSPCIDAGSNSLLPIVLLTDLAGAPRLVDDPNTDPDPGEGTAPIVDMGAYEYGTGGSELGAVAIAALRPNRPNPFAAGTTLYVDLEKRCRVLLRIHDVAGRVVRTLVDCELNRDEHEIRWDGKNGQGEETASGIYFARMTAAGETAVRKIVLIR